VKKGSTTTTTGYVWRGGAGPDLFEEGARGSAPHAVQPPLVPEQAATHADADGNRFGFGLIALVAGGVIGGVILLRSEVQRLFRRRPRASF
jgi:hypothetical protein